MPFHAHVPRAPLAEFVGLLWYFDGPAAPHARERLLPTGTTELIINLRANETRVYDAADPARMRRFPGAIVSGPHSECFVIDTAEQAAVLGVHFKAGGSRPFFAAPATEFHNTHVALADVWGTAAEVLREQVIAAANVGQRFQLLESALLARMRREVCHPAVAFALRQIETDIANVSIRTITAEIGCSARHFGEIFGAEVGVSPKRFARMCRFHEVIRRVHPRAAAEIDWADLAIDCGYYDQAHFIHDFRAFSGLTPSAYLAQRTPHLNHVPVT